MTPEEKRKRLRYLQLKKKKAESMAASAEKSESFLSKADRAAGAGAGIALDLLSAPFEVAGEAIRAPIEQDRFRAPSIVQRAFPGTRTEEPPSIGFDVANKLLRAGGGAISGIPGGTPLESARAAYGADRGAMGAVEDTALSLLAGRISPQTVAAPIKATGEVAKLAGQSVKAVGRGAKTVGKKTLRVGTGVSEEAQSAMFRRPAALKNVKTEADLAEDVARGHKAVESKIRRIEKDVDDVLRSSPYLNEGAAPKDEILKAIKNARKDIGFTVTDKQKYAKSVLDRVSGYLKSLRETVSERQQRDIIQKLDDAIPYGKQQYGTVDQSLMKIRRIIDRGLKKNEAYRNLMKEEVPLQRLKKDLVDKFGLKRSVGEGFVPTDATATKMKTILQETKEVQSQPTLKRLSKVTGQNYIQDVKDARMAKEFKAGEKSRGSARTVLGALTGLALEPFSPGQGLTTFAGGAVGRASDYYGGPMAKGIINTARGASTAVGSLIQALNSSDAATPFRSLLDQISRNRSRVAPFVAASRGVGQP